MPARNIIKNYIENGIYHVYNRGVEKRDIFLDSSDYKYFLWLLKTYLSSVDSGRTDLPEGPSFQRDELRNFHKEIELLAYCLMPNHFHLLIRQKNVDSMSRFMKSLGTNYSLYFNSKYIRVGSLFQGRYKAVLVVTDNYLLHLSRYIHLNPILGRSVLPEGRTFLEGVWSSYGEYLGERRTKWVKPEFVFGLFDQGTGLCGDKVKSYKDFVERYQKDSEEILGRLTLE